MKQRIKFFVENLLRFTPYFSGRLKAIEQQATLSEAALHQLQNEKFLRLLHKVYHHSPFYKSLYDKHGVDLRQIKSVEDIQLLPIITKQDVVQHVDTIFIGNKLNRFKAQSSGTSGQTVTVYRDYQAVIEEGAYQWAHRGKFGYTPGMRTVVLRGNLNIEERERYDPFSKTLYLSSFQLSEKNADWYYQRIRDFAPTAVLAYPSSMEALAVFFGIRNKSLHIPLIFTSSETLYSYQREKIHKVFGSRIVDWYGNAERTIALQQDEDGLYDQLPLYSINEDQGHHMVTTSLINASFPLIRYQVEDTLTFEPREATTYPSSRKVLSIQGRCDDVLLLPDGTRVGMACNMFDGIDHISKSQIVQYDLANIDINLVVSNQYGKDEELKLIRQIKENIGHQTPYRIRYVDASEIITSRSNKFKLVVNKMESPASMDLQ